MAARRSHLKSRRAISGERLGATLDLDFPPFVFVFSHFRFVSSYDVPNENELLGVERK